MVEGTNSGFNEALGLEIVEATPERVVAHVDCDARHHQPFGIVHGGVYASLVETVGSYGGAAAGRSRGVVGVVGVSNTTDFLRPHRTGRLDVVGTPIHVGRTQQLWQVLITRASDGALVARGQLRLQNLDALPEDRS